MAYVAQSRSHFDYSIPTRTLFLFTNGRPMVRGAQRRTRAAQIGDDRALLLGEVTATKLTAGSDGHGRIVTHPAVLDRDRATEPPACRVRRLIPTSQHASLLFTPSAIRRT